MSMHFHGFLVWNTLAHCSHVPVRSRNLSLLGDSVPRFRPSIVTMIADRLLTLPRLRPSFNVHIPFCTDRTPNVKRCFQSSILNSLSFFFFSFSSFTFFFLSFLFTRPAFIRSEFRNRWLNFCNFGSLPPNNLAYFTIRTSIMLLFPHLNLALFYSDAWLTTENLFIVVNNSC